MLLATLLFAQDITIPRTKTANVQEITAVRNECLVNAQSLMYYYYNTTYSLDDDFDDDRFGERNLFFVNDYIEPAFRGVIEISENEGYLIEATEFIENDFDPDVIISYMQDASNGNCRRGLDLAYILNNITFIADMLWHYNGASQVTLVNQITPIAEFAYELITNTDAHGDYTGTTYTTVDNIVYYSSRGNMIAAALGYAGLVLDNPDYVDCANNYLFDYTPIHSAWERPGFLGLNSSNNGSYSSGMNYNRLEMINNNIYYTASARNGENLWDSDYIRNFVESSLNYINPQFSLLSINDVYQERMNGVFFTSAHSLIPYYLKASDVLLAPYSLGCKTVNWMSPLKIFEFKAAKVPIIASDVSRLREICDNSECLFFEVDNPIDLGEKIKLIIKDKDLQFQLIKNAYQKVINSSYEKRCNQIIKFAELENRKN